MNPNRSCVLPMTTTPRTFDALSVSTMVVIGKLFTCTKHIDLKRIFADISAMIAAQQSPAKRNGERFTCVIATDGLVCKEKDDPYNANRKRLFRNQISCWIRLHDRRHSSDDVRKQNSVRIHAKLFRNGAVQMAGCRELAHAHRICEMFSNLLGIGGSISLCIVMINMDFRICDGPSSFVDRDVCACEARRYFADQDVLVIFDPVTNIGLVLKFLAGVKSSTVQVTFTLFATGSVTMVGHNHAEMRHCYERFLQFVQRTGTQFIRSASPPVPFKRTATASRTTHTK